MNMDKDNSYEIPFGAKDSEFNGWEYTIPEGMKARIEGNKIILEPKESEDERIRKALMQNLKERFGTKGNMGKGLDMPDVIAWLEKQGSQNLDNSEKTCKGEQNPAELPKGEDYGIDGLYTAIDILQKTIGKVDGYQTDDGILEHECAINAVKELYEQNLAWSEEDEIGFCDAMWAIEQARTIAKDENDMGNLWYAERWLKSLKERYTWKPSDEQMEALDDFIYAKYPNIEKHGAAVKSLYQDLKSLKG